MERKHLTILASSIASVLLAGCGSMPESNPTLEEARSLVGSIEREPVADRVAREQLAEARRAIEQADAERGNRRSEEDVDYYATVALRNAQIAEQLVATQRARSELDQAEADRTRVLLEAREREARSAVADARQAQQTAEQRAEALARQSELTEAERQRASELEAELAELQAQETERGLVMTLGDVLFETNESELQPGAAMMVDRLAEFLNEYPERRVIIEGHTDSTGAAAYNQRLSEERAEALQRALGERGIAANRVEIRGLGEDYPVASNDTAAGRQLNRRVEIVISDDSGEFTPAAERTVRTASQREREG